MGVVPASDFTVWFLSCGVGEWAEGLRGRSTPLRIGAQNVKKINERCCDGTDRVRRALRCQAGATELTIFEESRLPIRKWFAAAWLMTSHGVGA